MPCNEQRTIHYQPSNRPTPRGVLELVRMVQRAERHRERQLIEGMKRYFEQEKALAEKLGTPSAEAEELLHLIRSYERHREEALPSDS